MAVTVVFLGEHVDDLHDLAHSGLVGVRYTLGIRIRTGESKLDPLSLLLERDMARRLVPKLFSSSTLALFREGRRAEKVSLIETLHGYAYGRWIYLYIGTGLDTTRLARMVGPVIKHLAAFLPSRPPQNIHGKTGTLADSYHGKVVTLDTATQLVSIEQDISLTDLEHIVPFEKARDIVLKDSDHIAVLECPCRSSRADPCLPVDVCLIVGEPFAGFVAEHHPKRARTILHELRVL